MRWVIFLGMVFGLAGMVGAQGTQMRFEPAWSASMADFYGQNRSHGRSTLVTSDSVLHTAHVLFDYTLRAAELQSFGRNLSLLSDTMMSRLAEKAQEEAGKRYIIAPPPYGYDRAAAYFGVAYALVEPNREIPVIVRPQVEQELALIRAHAGPAMSPITGVIEDYSQYIPRGHYTRNEQFERYFLAMMWLGRAGFPISGEKAPGVKLTQEEARANAWAGIVLSRTLDKTPLYRMVNSPTPLSLWQSIYCPTQFIVGTSDDLTPPEYAALSVKVFGETLPGGWTPEAQRQTDQFIAEAIALRPPKIIGTVQSDAEKTPAVALRFFGQRYTPDSAIFQRLVHPQVPNRFMPSGLDVMAALGSPRAVALLRERGDFTQYPGYQQQLQALQAEMARPDADWQSTAYRMWLNTLRTLLNDQTPLPAGWDAQLWQDKQLNTALGSWAELRHDTILYTKQVYGGLTAVRPQLRVVYVEPVPEVYARLSQFVSAYRTGLQQQGVFPQEMAGNYDAFLKLLERLHFIALIETGAKIKWQPAPGEPTPQEWLAAADLQAVFEGIETLPDPLREQLTGQEDTKMALIADVFTDANAGNVLEVGVGNVAAVVVPLQVDGQTLMAYGPIFSYYEFPHPMTQRLTDAQWQKMLTKRETVAPLVLGRYGVK